MGDNGFHEWYRPARTSPKINTKNLGNYGWTAIDERTYSGPSSPQGSGSSEADAIDDLKQQLIERGLYANIE